VLLARCILFLLIHRRSRRLRFPSRFPLLRCNRGRSLPGSPLRADATRITVSTLETFRYSSLDPERWRNRPLRKIAWIFPRRLRQCASGRAMKGCELGLGSAGPHLHPTTPSLLHLHLDPGPLGEAIIINTPCRTISSRSLNRGCSNQIRVFRRGLHRRVRL
jgi:hypothetical protein